MNPIYRIQFFSILLIMFAISCSTNSTSEIDEEKPTITIEYEGGFPKPCMTLTKGETYEFRARVADNLALASYSLDIHHNFDHHTHDDQGAQCDTEPIKDAENPLIYMKNFTIEGAPTNYEIIVTITIPDDIDTGDYHSEFSVTDQTGWQSRTAIDIKITE